MKNIQSALSSVLLVAVIFVAGCIGPSHHSDPLSGSQGWRRLMALEYRDLHDEVKTDYKQYIQHLPPKDRNQLTESSIHFFGNVNGQHAVEFQIVREGFLTQIVWTHVLVYDVNNKRIKTMHYRSGRSLS